MSFSPDILSLERFNPHDYAYLEQVRAFPEGAMPEAAYQRMKEQYEAVEDASIQRIEYKNDGLTITGIMASPLHQPIKGLVVYNRGGSGDYGILTVHAILRQFVPLAREGYLVIGSNYRGNDGSDGKDEFGGGDVEDVFKLHEIACQHPDSPKDVSTHLIGHSRGGMMVFLMLKRGFNAKSAIALAPVTELREWNIPGSRMRERVYKGFIPNFTDNEEDALRNRSAICWPEAISCPLLMMHGTADEAVPHTHSERFAQELEHKNIPHELILFEAGKHALTRQWDEITQHTLVWLRHHD